MNAILLITQGAGGLLLLGTLVLLFSRRVYLDAATKEPIEFELPLFGKVKTQSPVLVLVIIAAFMVAYPIAKARPKMIPLTGEVDTSGEPVQAVVVADPDYTHSQDSPGGFKMNIPLLATDATYRVKFIVDKMVIDDQQATLKDGAFVLDRRVKWSPPTAERPQGQITARKDISDAELQKLGF